MLAAIVADFARIENCRVLTTWDRRLGQPRSPNLSEAGNGIKVIAVDNPSDERATFRRLAADSDATYVIAPEFDGILAERCRLVIDCGGRLIGPTPQAIELCADKLALANHLERHDIPTIPTQSFAVELSVDSLSYPAVIKPRDGAGSLDVFLIRDRSEALGIREQFPAGRPHGSAIMQPYVEGESLSVSAIVSSHDRIDVFPAGVQCLSQDGRFRYLGGQIPAASVNARHVEELIRRTCASIPGLRGYVGFDLIQTHATPHRLLIVEINPRLTTSYLGYRALTDDNLAERMLFPDRALRAIDWKKKLISFEPDGSVRAESLPCSSRVE